MADTEQLVKRTQEGDTQAQAALYRLFHARTVNACQGIVGSRSIAEELADDAFIIAFAKLYQLENGQKFGPWISQIARRLALRYRIRSHDLPLVPLDEVPDMQDEEQSMLSEEEILSAVDSLPQGYREVFRLSILDGKTHTEIAQQLGIQPHSSSSQLARAKRMLRTMLQYGWLLLLLPLAWFLLHREHKEAPSVAQAERPVSIPHVAEEQKPRRVASPTREVPAETPIEVPEVPIIDITPATDTIVTPTIIERTPLNVPDYRQEQPMASRWSFALTYGLSSGSANSNALPYSINIANAGPVENWEDILTMPEEIVSGSSYNNIITRIAASNIGNNKGQIVRTSHHNPPVEVALSANYRLSDRLSIGTGLGIMYLTSDFTIGEGPDRIEQSQRMDYLNVPVSLQYRVLQLRTLSFYASASANIHLPINHSLKTDYVVGDEVALTENSHSDARPILSAGIGIGVQWSITPKVSFFAEPTLRLYHTGKDATATYITQHPYSFSIPCGLRITF